MYEAFYMECEPHENSPAELHNLRAMPVPDCYFEYGLLHPKYDYAERVNELT